MLAFFAQIAYLAQNKHSHLAPPGYPVVNMLPKPKLTADKRKQTVSSLLLLVKDDTRPVELKLGALISMANIFNMLIVLKEIVFPYSGNPIKIL
jgi:hypothetical protein